jgi:hypothetical protein
MNISNLKPEKYLNLDEIIEAFLKWYENDPHRFREDLYPELKTSEYLSNLDKNEFIVI